MIKSSSVNLVISSLKSRCLLLYAMLCHYDDSASLFLLLVLLLLFPLPSHSVFLDQLLALYNPLYLICFCLLLLFGPFICFWSLGTLIQGLCTAIIKRLKLNCLQQCLLHSINASESTAHVLSYCLKVFYNFISSFS